ncbi:hypothetical protein B0H16DRAFT_1884273 [Mycena metata]|uniref:Uncharacterized protein n=1 Tax=Mycena metata TaxID=1033252 RepID=A0AAD7JE61_9AGAR|nr:hypothetical protein B0H16DRAFT_1884273 [Mycena metata]
MLRLFFEPPVKRAADNPSAHAPDSRFPPRRPPPPAAPPTPTVLRCHRARRPSFSGPTFDFNSYPAAAYTLNAAWPCIRIRLPTPPAVRIRGDPCDCAVCLVLTRSASLAVLHALRPPGLGAPPLFDFRVVQVLAHTPTCVLCIIEPPRASYASSAFPPSSTPIIRGRFVLQSHCAAAALLPALHETTLRSAHPTNRPDLGPAPRASCIHGRRRDLDPREDNGAYSARLSAISISIRTPMHLHQRESEYCDITLAGGVCVGSLPVIVQLCSSLAMVPSPPMAAMTLAFPFDATGRAPCVGFSVKNLGGSAGLGGLASSLFGLCWDSGGTPSLMNIGSRLYEHPRAVSKRRLERGWTTSSFPLLAQYGPLSSPPDPRACLLPASFCTVHTYLHRISPASDYVPPNRRACTPTRACISLSRFALSFAFTIGLGLSHRLFDSPHPIPSRLDPAGARPPSPIVPRGSGSGCTSDLGAASRSILARRPYQYLRISSYPTSASSALLSSLRSPPQPSPPFAVSSTRASWGTPRSAAPDRTCLDDQQRPFHHHRATVGARPRGFDDCVNAELVSVIEAQAHGVSGGIVLAGPVLVRYPARRRGVELGHAGPSARCTSPPSRRVYNPTPHQRRVGVSRGAHYPSTWLPRSPLPLQPTIIPTAADCSAYILSCTSSVAYFFLFPAQRGGCISKQRVSRSAFATFPSRGWFLVVELELEVEVEVEVDADCREFEVEDVHVYAYLRRRRAHHPSLRR